MGQCMTKTEEVSEGSLNGGVEETNEEILDTNLPESNKIEYDKKKHFINSSFSI